MANVFDKSAEAAKMPTMDDYKKLQNDIMEDAKSCGSFKKSFIKHCEEFNEEFLAHGVGANADRINPYQAGTPSEVAGNLNMTNMQYIGKYGTTNNFTANVDKNTTGTYTIADAYGIAVPYGNGTQADFEFLFPQVAYTTAEPQILDGEYEWTSTVLNGVSKQPGHKVKTWFADITDDEARARGYVKGDQKWESVFGFFNRETSVTTVYIKQKLDRDDIIDIGENFAIVPYIQKVMRVKLNQEIGRAILLGDNRTVANGGIDKTKIRPIWNDNPFYCIKRIGKLADVGTTDKQKADWMIEQCLRARKSYKGSGNPVMFTSEDWLATFLLAQDLNGHRIYNNVNDIAAALRVSSIVTVEEMESRTRVMGQDVTGTAWGAGCEDKYTDGTASDAKTLAVDAIIVNLKDYTVTTPKGGAIATFSDFDIDFNKEKYLMETRLGGACNKPFSIMTIEHATT